MLGEDEVAGLVLPWQSVDDIESITSLRRPFRIYSRGKKAFSAFPEPSSLWLTMRLIVV